MSTNIKTIQGVQLKSTPTFEVDEFPSELNLTRFSGGKKYGVMLQLTITNPKQEPYVQLTQAQVKERAKTLKKSFDYNAYPSE